MIPSITPVSKSAWTALHWPLTGAVAVAKAAWRHKLATLLSTSVLIVALFSATYVALPSAEEILDYKPLLTFHVSSDGNGAVHLIDTEAPLPVHLDSMPQDLENLLLHQEDRNFRRHFGVSLRGVGRALWRTAQGGEREGASSITQQCAKNRWLGRQTTVTRKWVELVLAVKLEANLSKDQILELYLDTCPFGGNTYGIEAAARRYFQKPASDLNLYECAVLVRTLNAPSANNWAKNPERAGAEAVALLKRAASAGVITEPQLGSALKSGVQPGRRLPVNTEYRWVYDHVAPQLRDILGQRRGVFVAVTTISPEVQVYAEAAIARRLAGQPAEVEAGLVSMESDGALLALVGGRDYVQRQFNHATLAQRQPGSLFKLPLYVSALQAGYEPESMLLDAPENGWPRNFDGNYHGMVTLENAFKHSYNAAAVDLGRKVGLTNVATMATAMGFPVKEEAEHVLLGTSEATLMDIVPAFALVANKGVKPTPYALRFVRNRNGRVIWQHRVSEPNRVLRPEIAEKMDGMLGEVVSSGTGTGAATSDGNVHGKTGTTSQDAWFIGYDDNTCTGVWIGTVDNQALHVTGGGLPATIFRQYTASTEKFVYASQRAESLKPAGTPEYETLRVKFQVAWDKLRKPSPVVDGWSKRMAMKADALVESASDSLSGAVIRLRPVELARQKDSGGKARMIDSPFERLPARTPVRVEGPALTIPRVTGPERSPEVLAELERRRRNPVQRTADPEPGTIKLIGSRSYKIMPR